MLNEYGHIFLDLKNVSFTCSLHDSHEEESEAESSNGIDLNGLPDELKPPSAFVSTSPDRKMSDFTAHKVAAQVDKPASNNNDADYNEYVLARAFRGPSIIQHDDPDPLLLAYIPSSAMSQPRSSSSQLQSEYKPKRYLHSHTGPPKQMIADFDSKVCETL